MENLCNIFGQDMHSQEPKENVTLHEAMQNSTAFISATSPHSVLDDVKFILSWVINPAFCIFGIIGNAFNILVLTRKTMKKRMDSKLERTAQILFIALVSSDLLYCMTAITMAFLSTHSVVFTSKGLWLFGQMYGHYVQNIFMVTSTWLTVILAAGRYAAICRPIHARYLVGVKVTHIAVICTFVFWALLQLPTAFTYTVVELKCQDTTRYILDLGAFSLNLKLRMTFTYLWALIGYFIPVVMLVYLTVHLIKALRESTHMRTRYATMHRNTPTASNRITPTLVGIVCMFLFLVSLSEILQFFHYTISHENVEAFNFALVVANILLTANYSFSFVMYCIVNVHFRDTCREIVFCTVRRKVHRNSEIAVKQITGDFKVVPMAESML